jgi:hypothetical protein
MNKLLNFILLSFKESLLIFINLTKIILPIILILKIIEPFGLVNLIADLLETAMNLVGLPSYTAIVWASAMLGGIYGGIIVLINLWSVEPLTVAQVSILSLMILIAHNLPVEVSISHKVGSNAWFSLVFRVVCAYFMGFVAFVITDFFNIFQHAVDFNFDVVEINNDWYSWSISQLKSFFLIFLVILVLIIFINFMKKVGIEKILHNLLSKPISYFYLSKNSINIVIIGLMLGIAYGGSLLIDNVNKKIVSRKEGCTVMNILNLNHSVIEDTLLVLLVGSTLWIVLVFRIILGLLLSFIFSLVLNKSSLAKKLFIS